MHLIAILKKCAARKNWPAPQLLRIMKLTSVLLLFACLAVSAAGYTQKISLSGKSIPIETAFKVIERQSGYVFFYDNSLLKRSVPLTINIKNASLDDVLKACFEGQPFVYNIVGRNIVVKPGKAPVPVAPVVPPLIDITGVVTDTLGTPLVGATIAVKNTGKITITDQRGAFELKGIGAEAILVVSYVGYLGVEVTVNAQRVFKIQLQPREEAMKDLVIIGYGTVAKKDLTGSVAQVNMSDLQKAPVSTFDQALAGRVAGVQVSSNDGQPGSVGAVVIRGNNSITQDNSPLYVVDGFPIEAYNESPVSPSDIESIQVLKDASATSIYGSRGANGVIIITTKQGAKSAPVISFNSYYGVQNITKKMEMMSPYEFVKYQNELNPGTTNRLYFDGRTLDDYKNMAGIDMQDALYQTAPMINVDLGFRGGNQQTQYSVFTNVFKSDGVILNSGFDRYQGKFTISQQISKNIKAYVNTGFTKTKTYGSIISDPTAGIASLSIIYSALGYRPVSGFDDIDLLDEFFDPAVTTETPSDYRVNPVISVKNEVNNRVLNSSITNGYIDFKITPDLLLKIRGGYINSNLSTATFYNSKTQIGNPNYPTTKGTTGGQYSREVENWLNENTLTYSKRINKHRLNALVGFTLQENKLLYSGYTANFIENEELGLDGIDLSTSLVPGTYRKEWSLASYLGRLNYDFASKYLLTFSFRADGSSKFRGNNKWGYFPSGAIAWRMKNEDFLKNLAVISDAKLRLSYGTTGNNRVDEYATYSGISFPYTTYYSFNNGTPTKGASLLTSTGVPDLRWETTAQVNIGYDLNLFKDRIGLVFDYYDKKTTDLLLNANLPYTTGYLTAFQNIGSVRNYGYEFTLETKNINKKYFKWNSSFNISFNRNKILKLQPEQDYRLQTVNFVGDFNNIAPYIARVGEPMGMIYGAVFDGLYQYADFNKISDGSYVLKNEIPDNGRTRSTIQPGDMKFRDLNNDGTINANDYTIIGNGNPVHIGGLSNDFQYRNFDLNIFLQWSYGNDILNGNRLYFEQNTYNFYNFNLYASVADRWTPEHQDATIPRTGGLPPRLYHTNIVEDGSFLRLKTVSLGYNFDPRLLARAKIKSARVYMSAQNLLTLTGYSGVDPEVSVRNSALTPGFDWSAYPRSKTIVFGLNLSF